MALVAPAQAVQATSADTPLLYAPPTDTLLADTPLYAPATPVQEALRARVDDLVRGRAITVTLAPEEAGRLPPKLPTAELRRGEDLARLYEGRTYRPLWDGPQGRLRLQGLLQAIDAAAGHGLRPAQYHQEVLRAALARMPGSGADGAPAAFRADRDLVASDAFLTLASHYMVGQVEPQSFDREWTIHPGTADPVPLLQDAAVTGDIVDALRHAIPKQPGYRALVSGLAELRAAAEAGSWPAVPEGPSLKPDMFDIRVPVLRERLVASGDLVPPVPTTALPPLPDAATAPVTSLPGVPEAYEGELVAGLLRFQRRHGLEPDGVVGPRTLAALNVPLADRIRQLELNLERWRWLPSDLGRRHVLVNIAGYDYRLIEDGVERLHGRTIVGRAYRSTPVFSDEIEYLVFSPKWTVPRKLAVEDKLPQILEDPDFLRREGFKVYAGWGENAHEIMPEYVDWHGLSKENFPYRLVQTPGAGNALGQVKFLFPNKHAIYLHDTPSRHLFERANRAFSSGCIRVEHPLTLAEHLLAGELGWNRDRIERSLAHGREDWVRLSEPVPVHLLHWTAWEDPDGTLQFRDDLYGRDARMARAMAQTDAGSS